MSLPQLPPSARKTIMVIDDDDDLREVIEEILTDEGYDVTSTADGGAALERMRISPPDLLLVDGAMPVLTGFEIMKRIQSGPQMGRFPIVLMSAQPPIGVATRI